MRREGIEACFPEVGALAQAAGEAILERYQGGEAGLVARKADESPVTMADLAAHRLLVEGLQRLAPSVPVVSEEDADSLRWRSPRQRFWLIDPLDGTKEFLARNGEFTVNVALVERGVSVWGVVVAPALGLRYWGGADYGAFRQEGESVRPLRVVLPDRGRALRVVASKSHLNAQTQAFISQLGQVELVQAGSSLKFCRLAEGEADLYPRLAPTCEWDTAAAQAVLEGAGGYVRDLDGNRLHYGKDEVLNPPFVAAVFPWLPGAA